ncbi:MAG TPA: DJ-1/PfpI family protein [Blastocatellia bacterium]|nr:DJ-1/PfpI family protein [Blastocatellia bacterium]
MDRKRVGILVFDSVEVLDFCGPFEVFSVTRLGETFDRDAPSPFEVLLVAEHANTITTTGGMRVTPDCSIDECPPLDILVVPGGWGTRAALTNERLLAWIADRGRGVETLASVCTGAMLLGKTGLLDGRRATTHYMSLEWMRDSFPDVEVVTDEHVVVDGRVITSAGVSAGIDMALRVVARYWGDAVARNAARHIEYPYPDDNTRRV